jgi:hypothetical protein
MLEAGTVAKPRAAHIVAPEVMRGGRRIGTFNLNNLFSRFNFYGEIDALKGSRAQAAQELGNALLSDDATHNRVHTRSLFERRAGGIRISLSLELSEMLESQCP